VPVYYLETSALVKKYRTERGTEVVAELFQHKRGSDVFVTSYFTVVEITSVATRLLRGGALTSQAYQVIMGNLSRDMRETVRLHAVSDSVLSESIRLTQDHALRAPDAIHVATALGVRAGIPGHPFYFLGSDTRLNTACQSSGLLVLDPEEANSLEALRNFRSSG
jgi:predicted nucleic acid-binding protein